MEWYICSYTQHEVDCSLPSDNLSLFLYMIILVIMEVTLIIVLSLCLCTCIIAMYCFCSYPVKLFIVLSLYCWSVCLLVFILYVEGSTSAHACHLVTSCQKTLACMHLDLILGHTYKFLSQGSYTKMTCDGFHLQPSLVI